MILRKYPLLANRYFLASIVFLIWVVFIDASSLISQYSGNRKLFELKREKRYYQQEIRKTKAELHDLFSDEHSLEKFARELRSRNFVSRPEVRRKERDRAFEVRGVE